MRLILLKTLHQGQLFAEQVQVEGHTRKDGTYVAPHVAIRHKAPEQHKPVHQASLFEAHRGEHYHEPEPKKAEPEPEAKPPAPKVEAPKAKEPPKPKAKPARAVDPEFEAAQDREDLADAMAADPHSEDAKAKLAQHVEKNKPPATHQLDDLDPSSPNYRYRDTGYVGGSRKEMAALTVRTMAREGKRVRVTDVDWEALEENPREAKELIVKSNLFGEVDWSDMRDAGMEPGAAFLASKLYSAVGAKPTDDTDQGRYDYSLAITTLRDRVEGGGKSVDDVLRIIDEIGQEADGVLLNESESEAYAAARDRMNAAMVGVQAVKAGEREIEQRMTAATNAASALGYEISKRERRKWKIEPAEVAKLEQLKATDAAVRAELMAYREANGMTPIRHQTQTAGGYSLRLEYPYMAEVDKARAEMGIIKTAATLRNRAENPLTRAWRSLGAPFEAAIKYRSHKGSEAFAKHVATVKAGRVNSWDWAEKNTKPREATKQSVTFQLLVADHLERVGGRPLPAESTAGLKDAFNLREVQSGNWVLDDPNSAKAHVEACAGGFADLADLLGIDDKLISFNGRLAMAFGARGRGGKGAAKAHYEPVHRVINMTKMAGAGSLAHEWFHCVDNLVREAVDGVPTDADDFGTLAPESIDHPELSKAFRNLTDAMLKGDRRRTETLTYTEAEQRQAEHNMSFGYGAIRGSIKTAKDAQAAVDAVEALYQRGGFGPVDKAKAKKNRDAWRRIALIHHAGNEARSIEYKSGPGMSEYMANALDIDKGAAGKYWSAPHEMAARAFSAFVEDRLHGQGRKNTYLADGCNNDVYRAMGVDGLPFPEGDERERINAACEALFAVIRDEGVLAKAMMLFDDPLLES